MKNELSLYNKLHYPKKCKKAGHQIITKITIGTSKVLSKMRGYKINGYGGYLSTQNIL